MHAKVLIVDAIATNRIVLKVKLASAFYEVSHAATVAEASQQALEATPDLIICGANLPDGDAAGLVKALAQLEETAGSSGLASVPVLALAPGLNGIARQCLLSAGVADVVADLENEALLVARVRSLIRAHIAENEWEIRDDTTRALGLNAAQVSTPRPAKVIVVADDIVTAEREARALRPLLDGNVKASLPSDALNFPQKGFGAPTRQRATRTEQFAVFWGYRIARLCERRTRQRCHTGYLRFDRVGGAANSYALTDFVHPLLQRHPPLRYPDGAPSRGRDAGGASLGHGGGCHYGASL